MLSIAKIWIFYFIGAKIMVHALNISCLDYYIGLLDRFLAFSIIVYKVKCTKLCSLFLIFLSSQEDDGAVFLAYNI